MSPVDLGNMGGMLHSTSAISDDGESLITELRDEETQEIMIISTRTRTNGEIEDRGGGELMH
jgi:hypothetical protein